MKGRSIRVAASIIGGGMVAAMLATATPAFANSDATCKDTFENSWAGGDCDVLSAGASQDASGAWQCKMQVRCTETDDSTTTLTQTFPLDFMTNMHYCGNSRFDPLTCAVAGLSSGE